MTRREQELLSAAAITTFRLNGQFLALAEELARPAGLTAAWWQVLGAVLAEPLTVAGIAREMGITRQSVQRVADILAERGLARYLPNPAHRRAKLLTPTEQGRDAIARIGPGHAAAAGQLAKTLGEQPLADAVAALRALSAALEKAVTEHGGTVLRVCRVLLGRHDADDAWSETFLAAMRAYPDLPETANVEAWLVTIAHRKAIDVLRARGRAPVPAGKLPEEQTGLGVPGAADDDLWGAVRALPDKQRQAIAYHYVAGLPYAEIAQILGGTSEAARRAAADGIKNLRKNYPGGVPS